MISNIIVYMGNILKFFDILTSVYFLRRLTYFTKNIKELENIYIYPICLLCEAYLQHSKLNTLTIISSYLSLIEKTGIKPYICIWRVKLQEAWSLQGHYLLLAYFTIVRNQLQILDKIQKCSLLSPENSLHFPYNRKSILGLHPYAPKSSHLKNEKYLRIH